MTAGAPVALPGQTEFIVSAHLALGVFAAVGLVAARRIGPGNHASSS